MPAPTPLDGRPTIAAGRAKPLLLAISISLAAVGAADAQQPAPAGNNPATSDSPTLEGLQRDLRKNTDPSGQPVKPSSVSRDVALKQVAPVREADTVRGADPMPRGRVIVDDVAELKRLKREHFGNVRDQARRDEGVRKLAQFRTSDSITSLYEELRSERDDVVLGMLDHVATMGEAGQAALAWMAIMDEKPGLRNEASKRLHRPASPGALGVLDSALRTDGHVVANRAGMLAGTLGATALVPLLIAAQTTEGPADQTGDLAWIAIQTQRSYVANLVPVTGSSSGAFQPVIGVIGEGAVLRIMDAVVISYRTEIHTALVGITSGEWGRSTEYLGYDRDAWLRWYAEEYKPALAQRETEAARLKRARQLEQDATDQELEEGS